MDAFGTFLLAALALTGSPGPNTLSLAAVGASFGRVQGLRYMIGLNAGMALVILIVGSGISGFILALPGAAPVITVGAAMYFIYLAYRIATAPSLGTQDATIAAPRWIDGTVLSLVNPKAYAAMAALFSGFVLIGRDSLTDGVAKAAVLMATIMAVNLLWLFAGSALTQYLRDARLSRIINIAFAVLLLVSVATTLLL